MSVYIFDGRDIANPEHQAMIQAFYSRSHLSIVDRVAELGNTSDQIEESLKKYSITYGHASIGDCANIMIAFEDVSILFAKVIQDNSLYAGTETSTRYMDFSNSTPISPVSSLDTIQQHSIEFYSTIREQYINYLIGIENPKSDKEVKAIQVKAFDVLRSLLPAGCRTKLSWVTSLRKAKERLIELKYHPLKEVREIADSTLKSLIEKYPNSIYENSSIEEINYYKHNAIKLHYSLNDAAVYDQLHNKFEDDYAFAASIDEFDATILGDYSELLKDIPESLDIPKALDSPWEFRFYFMLDYGSFRDIQRHRNGICRMPMLGINYGFQRWYLDQFPEDIKHRVISHLSDFEHTIKSYITHEVFNDLNLADLQYYIPMGYRVQVSLVYKLPQAVYVARLRTKPTVHPTLRYIAKRMAESISKIVDVPISYPDKEDYTKRATQDIIKIGE